MKNMKNSDFEWFWVILVIFDDFDVFINYIRILSFKFVNFHGFGGPGVSKTPKNTKKHQKMVKNDQKLMIFDKIRLKSLCNFEYRKVLKNSVFT